MSVLITLREEILVADEKNNRIYSAKGMIGTWQADGIFEVVQVVNRDLTMSNEIAPHAKIQIQYNDSNIVSRQIFQPAEPVQT